MRELLEPPCLWCSYSGEGYWQVGTHKESCPWRLIAGDDRLKSVFDAVRIAIYRERLISVRILELQAEIHDHQMRMICGEPYHCQACATRKAVIRELKGILE